MTRMNITHTKVAHHRNGVDGEGFHVVSFKHPGGYPMIAVVFDTPGQCAVLDVDLLSQGVIEFPENGWRGDEFEKELRSAIDRYEDERSSSSDEERSCQLVCGDESIDATPER